MIRKIFLCLATFFSITILAFRLPAGYTSISNGDVKQSYQTTEENKYLALSSSLILKDSYVGESNVLINKSPRTNAFIAITKNNTTLDLNKQAIQANKNGYVAIIIADDVRDVTIKNGLIVSGDGNFESAIIIGENTANITLENLDIKGCAGTEGSISFQGTPTQFHSMVRIDNVKIYRSATKGLQGSNIRNIYINNLFCSANQISKPVSLVQFTECNNIQINELTINNNVGSDNITCVEFISSQDIQLNKTILSNNSCDSLHEVIGIKSNNCENVRINEAAINNLKNGVCGINLIHSRNISLCDGLISNADSPQNKAFSGITIKDSGSILIDKYTISNNTSFIDLYGIHCVDGPSKDIIIKNSFIRSNCSKIKNNIGIYINDLNLFELHDSVISNNIAALDCIGLRSTQNTQNITLCNSTFSHNRSTSNSIDTSVYGVCIKGSSGVKIRNCNASYNNGGSQSFGFHIESSHACKICNSNAQLNWASPLISQAKESAGFYIYKSSHCMLTNCTALCNRGGSYAPGDAGTTNINLDSCCGGFGIINRGFNTLAPNIGNEFINCMCNGNSTQLPNSDPGPPHKSYAGGRYFWPSQALAAGAIEMNSKQTTYKNCTFYNNGISNYVTASGLIVTNKSRNIIVNSCSANNNNMYGYTDLNDNCETYFINSITLGNGSYNPVANLITKKQEDRNVHIQYKKKTPFYVVNMDDYSQTENKQTGIYNYNIIGRK